MNLQLIRKWFSEHSIQGELSINGTFQCFTMELPETYQGVPNVKQKCCAPEGIYPVELYDSPHFKRLVPILRDVPGRSSIQIHIANEPSELRGCIAVGTYRGRDFVGHSRIAFDALMEKIRTAIASGEIVTIAISKESE